MISFALILTGGEARGAMKTEPASCAACHAEFKSVLPQGHGPISGRKHQRVASLRPAEAAQMGVCVSVLCPGVCDISYRFGKKDGGLPVDS